MKLVLEANKRKIKIKNIARKSFKNNFIPAILYGKNLNTPVEVSRSQFEKIFPHIQTNSILKLILEKKEEKVFLRDYTISLKNRSINHIDFFAVNENSTISIGIPIELKGVAKGVLRGGVVRCFNKTIFVKAQVLNLPKTIEIDISNLDVGHSFLVEDLKLGEKLIILDTPKRTIVTVVALAKEAKVEEEESDNKEKETASADAPKKNLKQNEEKKK